MHLVELEIGLERNTKKRYWVTLRQDQTDSDLRLPAHRGEAQFDVERLRKAQGDSKDYGGLLTAALFRQTHLRDRFLDTLKLSQALGASCRIRLAVGNSVPELHALRWETLRHPTEERWLLSDDKIYFSRLLPTMDPRPQEFRAKSDLRALAVVANPRIPPDYSVPPIDVKAEVKRAKAGLGPLYHEPKGVAGQASWERLAPELRAGYDILYLVCHATTEATSGETILWLETTEGELRPVTGDTFAGWFHDVEPRPRLVVLLACQGAGRGHAGDGGALSAVGPRLVEAGVPVVLAMQGDFTVATASVFIPAFFRYLGEHGQIDQAVTQARSLVRNHPDAWMPALYMHLKSGRIRWYEPGFLGGQPSTEKWPALLQHIANGCCTPILGPELTEPLFGSQREMARSWADDETHKYPLALHQREDLPQVAQYLAVTQGAVFPREEYLERLKSESRRRSGRPLETSLSDSIKAVWEERRLRNAAEPHCLLAGLPFPIYVTANPDNVLAEALKAAGKQPRVEAFPWNTGTYPSGSLGDQGQLLTKDVQRPIVYHVFGRIEDRDSLVLAEDDYFDYLLAVGRSWQSLVPPVVGRGLIDAGLLFLGFRMDDWHFRALYRSLLTTPGAQRRKGYAHVAVQVDPSGSQVQDAVQAKAYLEKAFRETSIDVYWGRTEDFITDLAARWREYSARHGKNRGGDRDGE